MVTKRANGGSFGGVLIFGFFMVFGVLITNFNSATSRIFRGLKFISKKTWNCLNSFQFFAFTSKPALNETKDFIKMKY